jgi:NAD(P)-dependent dehydrogenase (short-subunit alcohol dehydrogenase family)
MLDFNNRVVLVTGAGKGIGRAQALALAQRGAKVVVNNRRHERDGDYSSADETVELIRAAGGEALADYHDVCDESAPGAMVSAALEKFSRLDGIVLNAAINDASMFHKSDMAHFQKVMGVNFFANIALLQQAIPVMREQGYGRVLFTISSAGLYGVPGVSAYAASKGAMYALMLSIAAENAGKGIFCNAIAPFAVSQMTAEHIDADTQQLLNAEGTCAMATYLLSEACSATGETWIVAGKRFRKAQVMESVTSNIDYPCETPEAIAAQFPSFNTTEDLQGFPTANHAFFDIVEEIKKGK